MIHLAVESRKNDEWLGFLPVIRTTGNNHAYIFNKIIEQFPLRGFPDDASYDTKRRFYCLISEPDEYKLGNSVSPALAEKWVKELDSKYIYLYNSKEPHFVTDPDFNNPSWLTTEELENSGVTEPEYQAVLAYMKTLEDDGNRCRLIFWLS